MGGARRTRRALPGRFCRAFALALAPASKLDAAEAHGAAGPRCGNLPKIAGKASSLEKAIGVPLL